MIDSFVLTVGLLISLPEATCFNIRPSQRGPHRPDTTFRLHSTPTIQPQSASLLQADELREMYSQIAIKDPQWMREYVVEMLDEDDEDLLFILRQAEKNAENMTVPKEQSSAKPSTITTMTTVSNISNYHPQIPVGRAKNETKSVTEVNEVAMDASLKNATSQILEQRNNAAKFSIEKTVSGKESSSFDHFLDRRSKTMKRDSSQVLIKQQPNSATLFSNGIKENPSLMEIRTLLGTNASTSCNSSQTAVKRNEQLSSPAVTLQNITSSVNQTQNVSLSGNASTKTTALSTARIGIQDRSEKIVIFSDSRLKKKQKVSLSKLVLLGYTTEEIISLDPDALSLIVEDALQKPSTGVPASWKSDKKLIQIESSDDLDGEGFELSSTKTPSPQLLDSKAKVNATLPLAEKLSGGKDPGIKGRRDGFNESAQATGQESKPTKEIAAHKSRASEKEERNRRVFTGRPEPSPPRDDPPPPKAFWPDIDTFRSLLRQEASLRLRILGDGWSQTVKDESEWRLGLYRNWLWTLHTGVGDPLVESRSDRMRRSSRDLAKTQSGTKGTLSNTKQGQRRKREE